MFRRLAFAVLATGLLGPAGLRVQVGDQILPLRLLGQVGACDEWAPEGQGVGAPAQEKARGQGQDILPPAPVRRFLPDRPLPRSRVWVFALAFSPDGKTLAVGGVDGRSGYVRLYDVRTGKELRTFRAREISRGLAFSPSGRLLASLTTGTALRLWDLESGKEVFCMTHPQPGGLIGGEGRHSAAVVFSPDGKILACPQLLGFRIGGQVWLWDTERFDQPRQLFGLPSRSGLDRWFISLAFSPDGSMLAGGSGEGEIVLWARRSGKVLREWKAHGKGVHSIRFTPDGRRLVSGGWNDARDEGARLWEVATGKELLRLADPSGAVDAVSISPDGRLVATGGDSGPVYLWDHMTGTELARLRGHRGQISSLDFSPDGTLLASGGFDGDAVLWDVRSTRRAEPISQSPLSDRDLDRLWIDLTAEDGHTVHHALLAFRNGGDRTAALLRTRLQPAVGPDPETIEKLIEQLDSPGFRVRENATRKLAQYGPVVQPQLEKALAKTTSAEARRRLDALLSQAERSPLSAMDLRALRAVQTLEAIRTPAAMQTLEYLARGYPEGVLTREARASLQRLQRKPQAPR
jgi:WD40 repeat protein